MATNVGYLVQLVSPEGDKVYPIISADMIKDSDGSTYDLSSLKDAVDGMGTTYATKTELEAVSADVEECFQSVSEGKSLIAQAVTDKGVQTAADATFQTMANNINSLEIQTDAIKQLTSGWTYRATSREIINNYYPDYTGTARLTSTNGIDRILIPRKTNRSGNLCGLYYDYTDYIQIKAPDCSLNANGTITISGYDAVYALSRISSVSSDRSWNITPLEYSVEDSTLRFLVPSHSWRYDGNTYTLTCNNLIITAKCGITAQAVPPSSSIIFDNESLHFVYTSSGI